MINDEQNKVKYAYTKHVATTKGEYVSLFVGKNVVPNAIVIDDDLKRKTIYLYEIYSLLELI